MPENDLIATDLSNIDWQELVDGLNRYLRLRTTPIGMKLFADAAEMEEIPRVRRPKDIHTTDQIVGQASRNGWTVGAVWLVRGDGCEPACEWAAQPAGHCADLRDAGADDPVHQRVAVDRLQEARVGLCG